MGREAATAAKVIFSKSGRSCGPTFFGKGKKRKISRKIRSKLNFFIGRPPLSDNFLHIILTEMHCYDQQKSCELKSPHQYDPARKML
jgi:hypothetical protein